MEAAKRNFVPSCAINVGDCFKRMALEKESVAQLPKASEIYKLRDLMKTRDMLCSMTMKIYENMTIDQKTRTCKVIP
jgi:hypothetical protein